MGIATTEELAKLLPPRDRRRRKRVLTRHNITRVALIALLFFLAVSVSTEFRRVRPGEHGRLYERRTKSVEAPSAKPYTVIKEMDISDQTGADPLLLEAARRQQYLGVTGADLERMREQHRAPIETTSPTFIPGTAEPVLAQNSNREKARFEITGGPQGVYVKRD